MFASQDRDRFAGIDRGDKWWREVRREVDLAASGRKGGRRSGHGFHIANIRKALSAQQLVGDIVGRNADAGAFHKADGRRFQPAVLSARTRLADEPGCAGRRDRSKEAASIQGIHRGLPGTFTHATSPNLTWAKTCNHCRLTAAVAAGCIAFFITYS